ncbi:helix-turn-helix transcriptional regulator [Marinobacter orientalis]|uniref:AraC family transcriptional regulator n=1 Tax=Marinobacter orientalis TaxID=1928859 RepID=A0A7Y0NK23_9GAMM|nr:AraC family transcriptional regulator [Marinobacter orientalis]NMT62307.1 AraC family transcriptional regulator [Marinobacter orientalis]
MTNSPRLSRKILSPSGRGDFRARLSCIQSGNLNVLGGYLRNASLISGANAGSAAIVMPVEGRVDFKVVDDHCLCGPWMPFLLEPDEDFHATLSEDTHLLIVQLPCLTRSGYRAAIRHHQALFADLFSDFLYETPFFRDYRHALSRVEHLSRLLYRLIEADYLPPREPTERKHVRDDRRLCNAIQLMHGELDTDINIESIASRSGLSLRNLHYLMKQYIGQSPYQYLRGRRLIKARESIIRGYPENTSIAQHGMNWGFQHAGRFSSYYEKHFGEYPSQTLSELDHLKELTDKVISVRDESENTRQQWLTSSAVSAVDRASTNPDLEKQES